VWGRRHAKLTWCAAKVNPPFQSGQFHSFADSSWADVLSSPKSTNSYDILCNNAVVSRKTKLSTIIATSSTEAELISAAYCAAEVAFIRKLAQELGFVQVSPTIIFEDDNGYFKFEHSETEEYEDEVHYIGTLYVPDLVFSSGKKLEGRLEGRIVVYSGGQISPDFYSVSKKSNEDTYDVFEFCNGLEYELDSFMDYVVAELDGKNKGL
jgi:hypothetical protein